MVAGRHRDCPPAGASLRTPLRSFGVSQSAARGATIRGDGGGCGRGGSRRGLRGARVGRVGGCARRVPSPRPASMRTPRRWTGSAVRCGGCASGSRRSSTGSARTPGFRRTGAACRGPPGSRCGSRGSTRSCGATRRRRTAGSPRRAAADRRRARAERGWLDLARSERARDRGESARLAAAALDVAARDGGHRPGAARLAQLGLAEVSIGPGRGGAGPPGRGDGGRDGRGAGDAGDVRGRQLHADARVRAGGRRRARRGSGAQVFEAFARKYDHVGSARLLPDLLRRRATRRAAASTRRRRSWWRRWGSSRPRASGRAACTPRRASPSSASCRGGSTRPSSYLVGVRGRAGGGAGRRRAPARPRRAGGRRGPPRAAPGRASGARTSSPRRCSPSWSWRGWPRASSRRRVPPPTSWSAIAGTSGRDRAQALARSRWAGSPPRPPIRTPPELLQRALNLFAALPGAARGRPRPPRARPGALAGTTPQVAIDLARRARSDLEALGAEREADEAAALMRSLGAHGRVGPRDHGLAQQARGRGGAPRRRGADGTRRSRRGC